jgi:hypothetical protein
MLLSNAIPTERMVPAMPGSEVVAPPARPREHDVEKDLKVGEQAGGAVVNAHEDQKQGAADRHGDQPWRMEVVARMAPRSLFPKW